MNNCLVAQAIGGGTLVSWAIWIVLVIAIVSLVAMYVRNSGIAIPPLFASVIWIVLGAVIIIGAIILISRFAGVG